MQIDGRAYPFRAHGGDPPLQERRDVTEHRRVFGYQNEARASTPYRRFAPLMHRGPRRIKFAGVGKRGSWT
jgi:hypothetical protein